MSYEEYDDSWDLEDQSKKCKRTEICLLASYECRDGGGPKGEEQGELPVHALTGGVAEGSRRSGTRDAEREPISNKEVDLPVHPTPGAGADVDRRAGTRAETGALASLGNADTGRYSNTAASSSAAEDAGNSNHTTGTVSQLYSKPRRFQSSWSQRILRTMITLMLFISSICTVGGNSDWRESASKIRTLDCNAPTMIYKLHLPEVSFILKKKWLEKLAVSRPAWTLEIEAEEPVTLEQWLDDRAKICPVKRILPANLRTGDNNLLISEELSTWFRSSAYPDYSKLGFTEEPEDC